MCISGVQTRAPRVCTWLKMRGADDARSTSVKGHIPSCLLVIHHTGDDGVHCLLAAINVMMHGMK